MNLWDSGSGGYQFDGAKLEYVAIERFGRKSGDSDHSQGSPCLNHIWVRVVENELSLTATLRSNDMFAAWPANAMGLRALQRYIRDEIAKGSDYDLKMGPLITISQSAHIYDESWEMPTNEEKKGREWRRANLLNILPLFAFNISKQEKNCYYLI